MDKDFRPQIESAMDWARNDETSKGPTCPVCGALLPPVPDVIGRHRDWHEQLEARLPSHGLA